ncbi:MAG: DUF262 domain-containing protein [Candidatus Mucispirillum faecigallinarum]|nr:DUF262 domain-containing protein [Candidatus Mucispirillum faecigallinarum]
MGKTYSENNNILELKSISNIHNEKFIIPSFQRGYRWEPVQVITLLEDIKEYIEKKLDTFMCLQPVVFYKKNNNDNKLEELVVVDGQQRLTTIAVISRCLGLDNINIEYNKNNKTLQDILNNVESYLNTNNMDINNLFNDDNKLLFEKTSEIYEKIFLSAKNNSDKVNLLDEYYIILSYLTIKCWLENEKNKNINIEESIKNLFESDKDNFSIKFIWYDVTGEINGDETKAINIFTRLNIGKIELTDAELIKALFLKKDNFLNDNQEQRHIANMWHKIENTLNNDSFWYFLSNNGLPRNERINLLLMLNTCIEKIENIKDYNLFREYYKKLQSNKIFDIWSEIENIYYTIKEWYNNYEIFHYVGFLINVSNKSLKELYRIYNDKTQSNKEIQRNNIKNLVYDIIKTIDIDSIKYNKPEEVRTILLFLEIYTSINANKNTPNLNTIIYRFPFNLYISEKWDIEHISSQTENKFQSNKDKQIWLENIILYYINNDELLKNIDNDNDIPDDDKMFLKDLINSIKKNQVLEVKRWETIFKKWDWDKIFNFFINYEKQPELDEIQTNCIGNLALLNSKINRAYKNAIFPVKRMVIINKSKQGVFIPTNTKNAFLKFYNSKTADTLNYWSENDINNYSNYIKKQMNDF